MTHFFFLEHVITEDDKSDAGIKLITELVKDIFSNMKHIAR